MKITAFTIIILLVFGSAVSSQKVQLLHFYAEAGAYQRINTPVSISLDGVVKSDTLGFQLYEKVKGQLIEKQFQVESGYVPRLWWILDGTTEAGKKREFFLYKNAPQAVQCTITTELTNDDIILKKGNSEILHYRKSVLYPPQSSRSDRTEILQL